MSNVVVPSQQNQIRDNVNAFLQQVVNNMPDYNSLEQANDSSNNAADANYFYGNSSGEENNCSEDREDHLPQDDDENDDFF